MGLVLKRISPLLLGGIWLIIPILSHFQNKPRILGYFIDLIVCLTLLYILKLALAPRVGQNQSMVFPYILGSLSVFPLVYFIFRCGFQLPYRIWSRFGAGSMELNGKIIPFGDLIHVTSASKCDKPILVGAQVCDLWGRVLNQNPHIIQFVRAIHFTNIEALGIISYLFFALVVMCLSIRIHVVGIAVPLFLMSSPMLLAIDRGNELITISLILLGVVLLERASFLSQALGALLLTFAAVFKLWPLVLVIYLINVSSKLLSRHIRIILMTAVTYWLFNYKIALELLAATQHGSPFGNSFGLKLFLSPEMSTFQQTLLLLITFSLYGIIIRICPPRIHSFQPGIESVKYIFFIFPLFFTYLAIWLIGDSFSYRAIVLLPALVILSQGRLAIFLWAKNLSLIILFTLLTARLPLFLCTSSAAALYIATFMIYNFKIFRNAALISRSAISF